MNYDSYLHLGCRSDRSIGKGLIKPHELVKHYSDNGVESACITDCGNLNSAVQLYQACKKHKLKPIFGVEVNIVNDKSEKRQGYETLTLLSKDKVGFFNLIKIVTVGAMYFYYVPRVDYEVLETFNEGIIALTSGINGVLGQAYFKSDRQGIQDTWQRLLKIYDEVYIEMQPVPTEVQRSFNERIINLCSENDNMMPICNGDPHYLFEDDQKLHEALLRSRNFRNQSWVYPYKGPYHVRSSKQMVDDFSKLHGYDVFSNDVFVRALSAPRELSDKIVEFDLREGIKAPEYQL